MLIMIKIIGYQINFWIEKIPEIKRIRYTTFIQKICQMIYLKFMVFKKINAQFIYQLHSGSDKILKLMNRKHSIKDYIRVLKNLKD